MLTESKQSPEEQSDVRIAFKHLDARLLNFSSQLNDMLDRSDLLNSKLSRYFPIQPNCISDLLEKIVVSEESQSANKNTLNIEYSQAAREIHELEDRVRSEQHKLTAFNEQLGQIIQLFQG